MPASSIGESAAKKRNTLAMGLSRHEKKKDPGGKLQPHFRVYAQGHRLWSEDITGSCDIPQAGACSAYHSARHMTLTPTRSKAVIGFLYLGFYSSWQSDSSSGELTRDLEILEIRPNLWGVPARVVSAL